MEIVASKFTKPGMDGDFVYMMTLPEHERTLFIFNDNIEFHATDRCGAGNAVVRPWNRYAKTRPTRSAGIPTGSIASHTGFTVMDPTIDTALREIEALVPQFIVYTKIDIKG